MIPSGRSDRKREPSVCSRREWLSGVSLATLASSFAHADDPKSKGSKDDDLEKSVAIETKDIETIAAKHGLGRFQTSRTKHYLAIGDVDDTFRRPSGQSLRGVGGDYLGHFKQRGFAVESPEKLLTIVALADEKGFRAFTGLDPRRSPAASTISIPTAFSSSTTATTISRPTPREPTRSPCFTRRRIN